MGYIQHGSISTWHWSPGPTPITVAGIYHNSDLGLISLSSDGSNWITIADKNLGATQVYNSGDTLSESNCGKYYQWGNNYGFPFTGATSTSSTKVNAGNYGPGNYYSSSTFITANPRDSSGNYNLRGGATGTNEAMQGPCDNGFHIPTDTEWLSIYNIWTSLGGGASDTNNFIKSIKAALTGNLAGSSGNTNLRGSIGGFWSSIGNGGSGAYGIYFNLNPTLTPQTNLNYNFGWSIRPFKNEAVQPDDSRTVLYQPS